MGAGEIVNGEDGKDEKGGLLSCEEVFGSGVPLVARLLVFI
jgi:hypothetical protein